MSAFCVLEAHMKWEDIQKEIDELRKDKNNNLVFI